MSTTTTIAAAATAFVKNTAVASSPISSTINKVSRIRKGQEQQEQTLEQQQQQQQQRRRRMQQKEKREAEVLESIQEQIAQERSSCIQLQAQIDSLRKLQEEEEEEGEEEDHSREDSDNHRDDNVHEHAKDDCTHSSTMKDGTNNHKELVALQTEVEGYRSLVNSLTKERPAIIAATASREMEQQQQTYHNDDHHNNCILLPLHIIQLLDIIPWHATVQSYIYKKDVLYEVQKYDDAKQTWTTIPSSSEYHQQHQHQQKQPKQQKTSKTSSGTATIWKPIGPWQIVKKRQKRKSSNNRKNNNSNTNLATADDDDDDDDDDGWIYTKETPHCLNSSSSHGTCAATRTALSSVATKVMESTTAMTTREAATMGGTDGCCLHCNKNNNGNNASMILLYRKRKWIRQRILMDYPMISETTNAFLKLHVDNACMIYTIQEIMEQFLQVSQQLQQTRNHCQQIQNNNLHTIQYYQNIWKQYEEYIKIIRYGRYKPKIEELICKQEDILSIISNSFLFYQLQYALRTSGAITNGMLQQGIHFYIQDHVRYNNNSNHKHNTKKKKK